MIVLGYELLCKEVTNAVRGADGYGYVLRHFVGHNRPLGRRGFIFI
jgi:hypothetical protein